jgi:hypothetical protein
MTFETDSKACEGPGAARNHAAASTAVRRTSDMIPPDYFYARTLTARNVLALSYGGRVTDFNGRPDILP